MTKSDLYIMFVEESLGRKLMLYEREFIKNINEGKRHIIYKGRTKK